MTCRAIDVFPSIASSHGEGGLCYDGSDEQKAILLQDLNEIVPMLMKRLDAKGTLARWEVPVQSGVFGLPWDCLDVRQVFLNDCQITLRDQWYEGQIGHRLANCGTFCGSSDLIDMGDGYATPLPWPAQNQDARYGVMAESDDDAGKTVQVVLKDRYGHEYTENLELLPNQQITSTEHALTDLSFQHKGITTGAVVGFVTYPHFPAQRILRLHPKVQTASFHRKKLPLSWGCRDGCLYIIGKLRFFPLTSEFDVLPICDAMALNFGVQALAAFKRRELAEYNAAMEFALNELNKELSDTHPVGAVSQMSVQSPMRFRSRTFY